MPTKSDRLSVSSLAYLHCIIIKIYMRQWYFMFIPRKLTESSKLFDHNYSMYLNDRWWVRDQVKFDPFQTSERLKTFGDLIFMIFLH